MTVLPSLLVYQLLLCINCFYASIIYTIFAKQVLPSSEAELTFTILVVDTSIPAPDPPPPMNALADVITTHFPDERLSQLFTE